MLRKLSIKKMNKRLKSLVLLAFGVFGLNFAFAIYRSTYTNFLVEDLNITAMQIGTLESLREVPGLLTAFILGLMLHISQPLLAGSSLLIFSLGMIGVSTINNWVQVVLWSVFWSIGFHCWMPLRSSITLSLSDPFREGERLGQMNSVASIAAIVAMASVAIFSSFLAMRYRLFFIIAGVISLIGGLLVLRIPQTSKPLQIVRFVFKRRYGIYYMLNFLGGALRQIFLTFSPFVLVKLYNLDVTMIATLMFISGTLTFLLSPYLGKLVDRAGPRITLTISYVLMVTTFLGYAYIPIANVLCILYIINAIVMALSQISQTTYINGISSVTDLTPSLAMGQTMNHVAAVTLPLTGGILWDMFGHQVTFLIGVVVAVGSLLTSQMIKPMKSEERH